MTGQHWAAVVAEIFTGAPDETELEIVTLIEAARRAAGLPSSPPGYRTRAELVADARSYALAAESALSGSAPSGVDTREVEALLEGARRARLGLPPAWPAR